MPADLERDHPPASGPAPAPLLSGPGEATPLRRPGSVRRTSSWDTRWPDGIGTQPRMTGRARDLLTPLDGGAPQVLAEDVAHVRATPDRILQEVQTEPQRSGVSALLGARAGGHLRALLAEALPEERAAGTGLYLLLDDLSGATLVAGFAFSQWPQLWPASLRATRQDSGEVSAAARRQVPQRRMEGICIGFRPGASSLHEDGTARWTHDVQPVQPVSRPDDPHGWHSLDDITEVSMRRARRIDVHLKDVVTRDVIKIDAFFQDSATVPSGGRIAVHEYGLQATADARTGRLLSVTAQPHVLPYAECPLAAGNVQRLVGTPLGRLREVVLDRLKGTAGCTHLNDALRALAEVPVLARPLLDGAGLDGMGIEEAGLGGREQVR